MRPLGIIDHGFRRIAIAVELDEQPEDAASGAVEPSLQEVQKDLDALRQWIDYFVQSKTMTDQEIQGLQDKVDFLESYVYDTTGGTGAQADPELGNRLDLLEQQVYEGPGTPEATPAVEPPARKQSPKKRKKKQPAWEPAAVPSDADAKKWWQW
jgi:hypothetical protein